MDSCKFTLKQVGIAFDQLLNAMLRGYADETLSSRAYRQSVKGNHIPRKVIDAIFFWQDGHCYQAYQSERARMQQPPEFRF